MDLLLPVQLVSNITRPQFQIKLNEIERPGRNDVLLGRGGGTNNHIGNIRFRQLVCGHKKRYFAATKSEKPIVASQVIKIWRSLNPPGRFLMPQEQQPHQPKTKIEDDGKDDEMTMSRIWFDVGDSKARQKASQCLRERTADIESFINKVNLLQETLQKQEQEKNHEELKFSPNETMIAGSGRDSKKQHEANDDGKLQQDQRHVTTTQVAELKWEILQEQKDAVNQSQFFLLAETSAAFAGDQVEDTNIAGRMSNSYTATNKNGLIIVRPRGDLETLCIPSCHQKIVSQQQQESFTVNPAASCSAPQKDNIASLGPDEEVFTDDQEVAAILMTTYRDATCTGTGTAGNGSFFVSTNPTNQIHSEQEKHNTVNHDEFVLHQDTLHCDGVTVNDFNSTSRGGYLNKRQANEYLLNELIEIEQIRKRIKFLQKRLYLLDRKESGSSSQICTTASTMPLATRQQLSILSTSNLITPTSTSPPIDGNRSRSYGNTNIILPLPNEKGIINWMPSNSNTRLSRITCTDEKSSQLLHDNCIDNNHLTLENMMKSGEFEPYPL